VSIVQRVLVAVLVSLLAAIAVVLVADRPAGHASVPQLLGPALPPHLRAADFALTDQNGRRVTLSQYRGHVVIVTFIHSQCHDMCPFMVEQIKGALDDLPRAGAGIPVLGISVAPSEDTRQHRLAFVRKHGMSGRMAYLNGPVAVMRQVWHRYAIRPVVTARLDDHSTFVLLIDRRGIERIGYPAAELTPEDLAHDLRALEREPA
jgi:protein SCO1/2